MIHRSIRRRAIVSAPALALLTLLALLAPTAVAPARAGLATGTSPVGTTEQPMLLSVRGAGPYRIGSHLADLADRGLLSWTAEGSLVCPDVIAAGATGGWAGKIIVVFRAGRLIEVGTATTPPTSPAGGAVGMRYEDLEAIYGPRGEIIHNEAGGSAYLVRIGSRVELYTPHPIRAGVGYYQAGAGQELLSQFHTGEYC